MSRWEMGGTEGQVPCPTIFLQIVWYDRFQFEVEASAARTDLTKREQTKIEEIEIMMEQLNQELYEAVDEELNQAGQDTKRVVLNE